MSFTVITFYLKIYNAVFTRQHYIVLTSKIIIFVVETFYKQILKLYKALKNISYFNV